MICRCMSASQPLGGSVGSISDPRATWLYYRLQRRAANIRVTSNVAVIDFSEDILLLTESFIGLAEWTMTTRLSPLLNWNI
jgi:hypothetical protein